MKELLYKQGFVVIEDFISPEYAAELSYSFKNDYIKYPQEFVPDPQCPKSPGRSNGWRFLELLCEKVPTVKKIIGEPVFPTYCYSRLYKKGEKLTPHIDRAACEISLSVHLESDGVKWPICFRSLDTGEEVELNLKPGQAVLYLGIQTEHWRKDEYQGNDYSQVFLHYVKARGNNKWHVFNRLDPKNK